MTDEQIAKLADAKAEADKAITAWAAITGPEGV